MFSHQEIHRALHLKNFDGRAAQMKMAPVPRTIDRSPDKQGSPRIGAVLLMLYVKNDTLSLLLIKRQKNLQYHPGQISFPGGRQEHGEPLLRTSLRETEEEVGISPEELTVLAPLEAVYIPPSDFIVHPFVARHNGAPVFHHDPKEVDHIIEVPVSELFKPESRAADASPHNKPYSVLPYFKIDAHRVWGATAMILSEFVERLKAAKTADNEKRLHRPG